MDVALSARVVDSARTTRSYLLAPLLVYLVTFLVIPIALLARMSLHEQTAAGAYEKGLTIDNYVEVLTSEFIHGIVVFTLTYAMVTTILVLLVSIPYAYVIWRVDWRLKVLLLGVVILQLLTAFVTKLYAWILILSPEGAMNRYLIPTQEPISLVNTASGAIIGQTYVLVPFAVLAIYSVLVTIDWTQVEAARDLGASRPRSVLEIVLPQALPGIAAAAIISFSWTIGSYAAPLLLGSTRERTLAIEVTDRMVRQFNWPVGATLAMMIIIGVLVMMATMFVVVRAVIKRGVRA